MMMGTRGAWIAAQPHHHLVPRELGQHAIQNQDIRRSPLDFRERVESVIDGAVLVARAVQMEDNCAGEIGFVLHHEDRFGLSVRWVRRDNSRHRLALNAARTAHVSGRSGCMLRPTTRPSHAERVNARQWPR